MEAVNQEFIKVNQEEKNPVKKFLTSVRVCVSMCVRLRKRARPSVQKTKEFKNETTHGRMKVCVEEQNGH